MTIDETCSKLVQLKLFGMAEAVATQRTTSRVLELSFEDRLSLLVDQEMTVRENRRLKTMLKMAKLKVRSDLSSIDYDARRNIDRSYIANLATCNWIRKGFNLLIAGATGTGKTYLACALGHQSCLQGLSVQFHRVGFLLDELRQARIDGSIRARLKLINRSALLILDDFGIKGTLSADECEVMYELIDGRHGTGAMIITSQLPTNHWHGYLQAGNPTTADAIMDRILTNGTKLELKGESLRPHLDVLRS